MGKTNKSVVLTKNVELSSAAPTVGDFNYDQRIALLTPEEKEKYKELSKKLTCNDLTTVQTFGNELSQVIATNGDMLLNSVRADNSNEVIEMTNDLLAQLNLIDFDQLEDTRWKRIMKRTPFLRKFVKNVQNFFNEYDTIASNVDKISQKIGAAKIIAMRDNSTLEQIFDNNITYIGQLRELIIAAKLKLSELKSEIEKMQQDPNVEVYQINDMQNFQNAIEHRIADMETEEYILTQNQFQIRATQHNNLAIADKADNIVNSIIPVWKNQLALTVIMNNQKSSAEAEHKITETTNQMLRKNAQTLKLNSINVAKETERQVVDLETLNNVTQNLVETINEVKRIHEEGARNREAIEKSLQGFAEQLNNVISNQ